MQIRRILLAGSLVVIAALATSAALGTAGSKAACNNSNAVTFGVMNSMSGPAAGIGKLNQQGMDIALNEVNAAGGVLGRCLKRTLKDDAGDPTKAAQVVRELVDQDGVKFVIGPFLSSPTAVALPILNSAKVININESANPIAGNPKTYPYTFLRETPSTLIAQLFANFVKANGYKKVAILAVNNALGQTIVPALQQTIPAAGATITGATLVPAGTVDLTPQFTTIKNQNPDIVVFGITDDPTQTAAIKAKNQLGIKIPIIGYSSMGNPGTVNNFKKAELDGVYAAQIYKALTYVQTSVGKGAPIWPPAKKFVAAYAKALHSHNIKQSVSQSAGGYDSVKLLAWAINGAKSTDADKVKEYIETHRYTGVRGVYIFTPDDHAGVGRAALYAAAYANSLNAYGILRQAIIKK